MRLTYSPHYIINTFLLGCLTILPCLLSWGENDISNFKLGDVIIENKWEKFLSERFLYSPSQIQKTSVGATAIAWAEKLLRESSQIPQTTYTLYREFQKSGDRKLFEKEYFHKRAMLTATALLIYLKEDTNILPLCNDLIWSICEETNWVVPAHERKEKYTYIDLFSAETATLLAHILLFLDDKLPQEIKDRIKYEVQKRVMCPYLFYSEDKYGWVRGYNNWTGVCAGSIGETFLILEDNQEILKKALNLVIKQLSRFIKNAFAEDGGCLEGISYWNYGLTHFISFSELLYESTNGKVNLLSNPKMFRIAQYPYTVYLGNHKFASFSDAPSEFLPHSFIVHRIVERLIDYPHNTIANNLSEPLEQTTEQSLKASLIDLTYLHELASPDPTHWLFGNVIRNILWSIKYENKQPEPIILKSTFLPISGLARLVYSPTPKTTYILACKAGSNSEPHNHNDIGSFIFCVNNTIFLTDPGAGLYSREYFSAKRYENIFANSYGHSVPVIGGKPQSAGDKFRGKLYWINETSVNVDFTNAYDVPTLKSAIRTYKIYEKGLTITDSFLFENNGEPVQEALLTWLPVKISNKKAIITSENGILEITTSVGKLSMESLKDHCIRNNKDGVLTRITIDIPPKKEIKVLMRASYIPNIN
ncbi:MAG: heparinase II/III-family protein [Candidatus Hydrogenedentes bacterium]|nr:heparinase II/III-family protein [Candidatus Hydrogenedentota bacterium]